MSRPSRRPQPTQSLNWCFTLNNYVEEEDQRCRAFAGEYCNYAIFGYEVGESGTPHIQGYFRLKSRCRLSQLKDRLSERAHFESAKGNAATNYAYCSKSGSVWEHGTRPKLPGKSRNELATEYRGLVDRLGRPGLDAFRTDNPGVFAFSGHLLYRNHVSAATAPRREDIYVEWIYGPPGVGKSRRAHEEMPEAYIKDPRTKWWNGYLLEKEVIIDDFAPNGIDINHLLRWFDRYRCYVEVKGDMCALFANKFIVTSNFSPAECFTDNLGVCHVQLPALERRINIIHME